MYFSKKNCKVLCKERRKVRLRLSLFFPEYENKDGGRKEQGTKKRYIGMVYLSSKHLVKLEENYVFHHWPLPFLYFHNKSLLLILGITIILPAKV